MAGSDWTDGENDATVADYFAMLALEQARQPFNKAERNRALQAAIGPPPTVSNAPDPKELEQMMAIALRHDVAGRDERNRALGRRGEELVLQHERRTLAGAGRRDLAGHVRWVSEEEGDGAGYDIASFRPDGGGRLIEVKTTNGWERTPFHISRNELAVAQGGREWCLLRLWNFSRKPRAFKLHPPLEAHVALTPTSFMR